MLSVYYANEFKKPSGRLLELYLSAKLYSLSFIPYENDFSIGKVDRLKTITGQINRLRFLTG
jgi:hypothetical protein